MPNVGTVRVAASPLSVTLESASPSGRARPRVHPILRFRECHQVLSILALIGRVDVGACRARNPRHVFAVRVASHPPHLLISPVVRRTSP
jgi:hypothetical protein